MTRTEQPPIPLLSLSGSTPADFLAALGTTGFIHLSLLDPLSPVSPGSVRTAFSLSDVLFDDDACPVGERARFPRTADPDLNGYMALRTTALNREGGQKAGDWKETFGYGRCDPPLVKSRQGLPKPLDARRDELEGFHRGCYELMLLILDKISLALDLEEGFFRSFHDHKGASSLTMLNYPVPPEGVELDPSETRAGAHADWGSLTLLFQEDGGQPGLEIFLPTDEERAKVQEGIKLMSQVDLSAGTWHPAPIVPGTVLVNLGLMLEAWSSGKLRATLHRVVFPHDLAASGRPRRSCAFFGTADAETRLVPIQMREKAGEEGESGTRGGEPITAREFLWRRLKLAETY